jgi:hypothetical protein
MGPAPRQRLVAIVGVLVGLMMILMKIVPMIPGHFSVSEWIVLAIWIACGAMLARRGSKREARL